jgi:hypothetical protein
MKPLDQSVARYSALERENQALRADLAQIRQEPPEIPFVACDNSCVVAKATGMATNGGCRCDERTLRRAIQFWRGRARYLQSCVQLIRDGSELIAKLEGLRALHMNDAGECPMGKSDCLTCGALDCPKGEPLHYDKDGCPICAGPQGLR